MEGDWLGNPANIKGIGYCFDFEVDTGSHVTMTVQSFKRHSKTIWRRIATFFLFGDDLDAVLEALEGDDNVDEYFEEAVTEVSGGIRFYS